MKITTLLENYSYREDVVAQYGLALLVETAVGNVIVDAGQDETVMQNYTALGLNEVKVDAVFVSHNHYDHIGGLQSVIDATQENNAPVYVSGSVGTELYTKRFLRRRKLVSRNALLAKNAKRLVYVEDQLEILPGVYACRVKGVDLAFVCKDKKLKMLNAEGKLVPDDFSHETYLAVIEDGGVKIVSSCSHNGVVNIVRDAKRRFQLPVTAFVGGLHMRGSSSRKLNCSKAYANGVFEKLNDLEVGAVYTCHCTGLPAFQMLKAKYKGKAKYFHTAETFTV